MTKNVSEQFANLSGAYVLNALDEFETRSFEEELTKSEQLRNEVTELQDTATLLGLAIEPILPSAELKTSLMNRIATLPQVEAIPALTWQEENDHASAIYSPSSPATDKAKTHWYTRPVALFSASAAVIAIVAGGVVVGGAGISAVTASGSTQADKLAAITQAADISRVSAPVKNGGTASVIWSDSLKSSAIVSGNLTKLPSNKEYELWYINSKGIARSAGALKTDDKDTAWSVLDGRLQKGDSIGVTVEPTGGSPKPTTAPVVEITT
jgi:anti-sigma-K factor RskA